MVNDLNFDLSRPFKVKYNDGIGLLMYGFIIIING